jgi:hypothetical protein
MIHEANDATWWIDNLVFTLVQQIFWFLVCFYRTILSLNIAFSLCVVYYWKVVQIPLCHTAWAQETSWAIFYDFLQTLRMWHGVGCIWSLERCRIV